MRLALTTKQLLRTTVSLSLLPSLFVAGQQQVPFSTGATTSVSLQQQSPLSDFPNLNNMATPPNESIENPSELATQRIADAQQLFGAKPNLDIFKRSWHPNAIFEDPICYATGWNQYAAQWWAMQLFSKSITSSWRVIKDEPREIQYVQKQVYGIDRFNFEKTMYSTVVMKLDQQGRIVHFVDKWDHKDMPGGWAYPLRRLNAYVMPWFISKPKQHPDGGQQQDNNRKDL